jgi:programmed cell death protein 5
MADGFETIDSSMLEGAGGELPSQEQFEEQKQKQAAQEDKKNEIVASILSKEALARLGSLEVVKPERVQQVQMMVLQMAQSGRVREKVSSHQPVCLAVAVS